MARKDLGKGKKTAIGAVYFAAKKRIALGVSKERERRCDDRAN